MNAKDFNNFLRQIDWFVINELIPLEEVVDNTSLVPEQIQNRMKQMGLFGVSIDSQYGGLGLTIQQEIELMFVIGKTTPVFQSKFGTNQGLGSYLISKFGSNEQKNKYLSKIASGNYLVAFAATEINAGSDIKSIETSAYFVDDDLVINGSKRYITNAQHADVFIVLVKVFFDKSDRVGRFTIVIIEKNQSGVTVGSIDSKMGQNGVDTSSVYFQNCVVHKSAIIGEIGEGLKLCYKNLNKGRLVVASISIAIAKRLIDESIKYAKKRQQFGKCISQFQIIQLFLANMYTEYSVAKAMVEKTANNFDDDNVLVKECSICKYYATEMVGRVADKALQIWGGEGYMKGTIERFFRDVRLLRIYEGTSEIQQLIIAKQLLEYVYE